MVKDKDDDCAAQHDHKDYEQMVKDIDDDCAAQHDHKDYGQPYSRECKLLMQYSDIIVKLVKMKMI